MDPSVYDEMKQRRTLRAGNDLSDAEPDSWRWRDLRDVGIGFSFWPLNWSPWFKLECDDDRFGGVVTLMLGPLILQVEYNAHSGPFGKPLADE